MTLSVRHAIALSFALAVCVAGAGGCAAPHSAEAPIVASLELHGSDGADHAISRELSQHRLTVFIFYSEGCPCFAAHEPRLTELERDYRELGVAFFLVNSETGASIAHDAERAFRRRLAFPLLTDSGAQLARALGAEFATHSIVVDAAGRVVYSGAFDSDKNHLRADATPYLRDALDDALAKRTVRSAGHEALGCALQLD
ncbi:MAG TPA: redoxin family protein [Polyangiaceae bacterium]|nr:redoxin family protein [Polyangiaceae bacterium]